MRRRSALSLPLALLLTASPAWAAPFDDVRELLMSLEDDFMKFYDKGNGAAGTRVIDGMKALVDASRSVRARIAKDASYQRPPVGPRLHGKLGGGNRFDQLRELLMSLEDDFVKFFDKGNGAAGARVIAGLHQLEDLAKAVAKEVRAKQQQR